MVKPKPNHICKYSGCTLGENGTAKHYYACDYCDRVNSWRSVACCKEHYELYIKEILDARSADKKIKPIRTDINEEQFKDMLEKPIEDVKKSSERELTEFTGENITEVDEGVEKVNAIIEKNTPKRKRSRNKK